MTPRNRNILIIAICAGMLLLGTILFFATNNKQTLPESGGSGVPDAGTLILKNVDSPTNDGDAIPLSTFLTTDVQTTVRDQLQAVLQLQKMLPEYDASVTNGSVTIDYNTNDLSFTVHVDNFNSNYKLVVNTVSGAVAISDASGKKVN
jgi:hypothetical protein